MRPEQTMADRGLACALALGLFLVYNANGREIGSYDSQPTKYAARELLLRGTLSLNHVVGLMPQLAERPAFVMAERGRYRSAYSPVPAILAAAIAWPLWKTGVVDIRAPRAPSLIAALGASVMTAIAVALVFLAARQVSSRGSALLVATGLGLGTGFWSTISQTLWQHESAALGLSLFVLAFTRREERMTAGACLLAGIGLAMAGASRPQLAPAIAVLLAGMYGRARPAPASVTLAVVAIAGATVVYFNLRWFGHPMGAAPGLEAYSTAAHRTLRSFAPSFDGFFGLLVSPNRGLVIFSPIVLVALGGIRTAVAAGRRSALAWCGAAAAAEYVLYACYGVWWGGHTYGPRYLLDVLPLLAPLAAVALSRPRTFPGLGTLMAGALAWSILVAATGAFFYPNDQWNVDPDVNRFHERLWDWSDMQIGRCWGAGPSPQNFSLFSRDAFRVP